MEVKDPHTLLIKTYTPFPLLPNEVAAWGILSATANGVTGDIGFSRDGCTGIDSYPKTEDFNSGKAAIGTGMYKFKEFTRGEEIVFERNDDYWGDKGAWETVTFRPITSDRSEEHTSELQSLMRISYAVFCLKKKNQVK